MENTENNLPYVSVVILSFNRRNDLDYTLQKVFEQNYPSYEVIVVDNNSADGSAEMVKKKYPVVTLLCLPENIGIAGWNEGAKIAKGEYLLFLDDDSYPERDALNICMPIMEQYPNCAVLALNVYNDLLRKYEMTYEYKVTFPNFVGCGVIIRREMFYSIGMFNKRLFLYEHEIDFSIKTIQCGYDILFSADAVVHHIYSSIHRQNTPDEGIDLRKQYFKNRSIVIILLELFSFNRIALRLSRVIIGRLIFGLVRGCAWTIFKGFSAGLYISIKNTNNRHVVSDDVQKQYGYGIFAGGFFHGGQYAFKRPLW